MQMSRTSGQCTPSTAAPAGPGLHPMEELGGREGWEEVVFKI